MKAINWNIVESSLNQYHYFNIFWNLNTEVDICVQFKYLSTRPCNCTYYIDLFVYSCVPWSGNITTSLMVPLYVLCLWCWVYLIHFLCCFTRSNDILYIWLTPPPFWLSQCVYLLLRINKTVYIVCAIARSCRQVFKLYTDVYFRVKVSEYIKIVKCWD
jgi:hypothetical protein